jgi:hypothetical protein
VKRIETKKRLWGGLNWISHGPHPRPLSQYLFGMGRDAQKAVPSLIELSQTDSVEGNRIESIYVGAALSNDDRQAVAGCIAALRDKSPNVRGHAARLLGKYGLRAAPAVEALTAALDDKQGRGVGAHRARRRRGPAETPGVGRQGFRRRGAPSRTRRHTTDRTQDTAMNEAARTLHFDSLVLNSCDLPSWSNDIA